MQYAKRQAFLDSFLKLFGANSIAWTKFETNKVYGTVIYDTHEQQDFCWHMAEENVPTNDVLKLIDFLKSSDLIDSDKIAIPLSELFTRTKATDFKKFMVTVEELMTIKVSMIDKGEESDTYFIHI